MPSTLDPHPDFDAFGEVQQRSNSRERHERWDRTPIHSFQDRDYGATSYQKFSGRDTSPVPFHLIHDPFGHGSSVIDFEASTRDSHWTTPNVPRSVSPRHQENPRISSHLNRFEDEYGLPKERPRMFPETSAQYPSQGESTTGRTENRTDTHRNAQSESNPIRAELLSPLPHPGSYQGNGYQSNQQIPYHDTVYSGGYQSSQPRYEHPALSVPIYHQTDGMPSIPSTSSQHVKNGYCVPFPVQVAAHTSASFESQGSSNAAQPYILGAQGHLVAYSFGPHPTMISYPGYPHQQPYYPAWVQSAPPPAVEYIKTIKPMDVLCGRGGATNSHSGNRSFRSLVKRHQERYLRAKKRDKPSVASVIVDSIREKGGRFLRRCESSLQGNVLWVDIGDERAREKTCQALREGAPELRRRKSGSSDDEDSGQQRSSDVEDDDDIMSPSSSRDGIQSPHHDRIPKTSRNSFFGEDEDASDDGRESEVRDDRDHAVVGAKRSRTGLESTIIRPSARLMQRVNSEITLEQMAPNEQEMYLRDFLPPESCIRKGPNRKKYLMAREIRRPDEQDDEKSCDDPWPMEHV